VGATTETILVNAKGLPLYYYRADTATKSQVSGGLARFWPPLVSTKPTASGVKGKVVSVKQADGHQVSYNGHFLYTFIDDSPGRVTGQGVSNFFVATPTIRAIGSSTTAKTAPAPATPSRGYGY
jgi:predicted lipoprotein with Yx(FWY)xxD motif